MESSPDSCQIRGTYLNDKWLNATYKGTTVNEISNPQKILQLIEKKAR